VLLPDLLICPDRTVIHVFCLFGARYEIVSGEFARDALVGPVRIGQRIEVEQLLAYRVNTARIDDRIVEAISKLRKPGYRRTLRGYRKLAEIPLAHQGSRYTS